MKLLKPIEQDISYQLIRSCVTRKIRKGEVPGEIYDFISEEEFSQRVKRRDFLEIAYVHNNGWYATPKSNITEDKFGLKIIDPQGCEMVIKTYDSKADIKPYFVIIDIPLLEMVRRLNKRGTEDMTEKAKRLWSVLKEKRLINKIREYATSASVENTGHIYDTRLAVYNILANQNIVQRIDKYPSSFF
jgi:guanylate kinase